MADNTTPRAITCKAAVVWNPSEPLKVEEVQVDPPNSTQVRVKMLYASMCHTDITYWNGHNYAPLFPRILGHEGAGVIESVGGEVKDLKVGDNVMLLYVGECGECSNCASEKTNLCSRYPLLATDDGTSRIYSKGQRIYRMFGSSTWAEYAVMESNYVVKVDPRMPLSHACLLTCGFTTGYGGVWKGLKVEKGSSVAVLGLGAVGLGAVKASQIIGASKIFGIDVNDMKRDKAIAFGVTDFVNPKHSGKPISQLILEATDGLGVDYCFECTGVASVINEATASTKMGVGETLLIGFPPERKVELNLVPMIFGRTLKGTNFGGVKIHSDLPKIVEKCINKEINLGDLITHEVSLADINKGFMEYMKQPNCVKVIIKF
ncbi:8-hydroxygeraniol oxidoreductase-like [Salvia hispanica]|uniref:8-hydroxygeraniol oxidoreductase-like n=1 Tax=Salvia hispanica TaxID=49212 RepID=UPI0020095176|nr:8-hydroxygeraniol oxidoreductase-like [Salvia hispanica]